MEHSVHAEVAYTTAGGDGVGVTDGVADGEKEQVDEREPEVEGDEEEVCVRG